VSFSGGAVAVRLATLALLFVNGSLHKGTPVSKDRNQLPDLLCQFVKRLSDAAEMFWVSCLHVDNYNNIQILAKCKQKNDVELKKMRRRDSARQQ
jgi:hypothetical protein